jgi:hypothetical protein
MDILTVSIFCKLKQAQVHVTWYGDAIAVTILGSSSRFFIKIVRSSRGAQMGFYVPVAAVLCRTVRPPEPTMQTTTIIDHGRIGLLLFFASPSTRGAKSFLYYRSMPWIDSTKKIRRKTASGNSCFTIYRVQKHIRHFLRHGEENAGYLLISAVFLLTTFSNIRTRCASNIRKSGKQIETIVRAVSAMTGLSVMVEIVLQKVFPEIKMK